MNENAGCCLAYIVYSTNHSFNAFLLLAMLYCHYTAAVHTNWKISHTIHTTTRKQTYTSIRTRARTLYSISAVLWWVNTIEIVLKIWYNRSTIFRYIWRSAKIVVSNERECEENFYGVDERQTERVCVCIQSLDINSACFMSFMCALTLLIQCRR